MRKVTVYYAYDDSEFSTREECVAYEEEAIGHLREVSEKYSFFDENMNLFCAPVSSTDVDEWVDWLSRAADKCTFIHRDAPLSKETERFVRRECGYCILNDDFPEEGYIGWFKWDNLTCSWVKVD